MSIRRPEPGTIKTFGEVDVRSLEQLRRSMADVGMWGVLSADHHPGYGQPIGGAVAYPEHISPSGVGFDIGCGNKAARTPLRADDLRPELPKVIEEIERTIAFGLGRKNAEPVDHPVLDRIAATDFEPQRRLLETARSQLGTVGGGNHYVDLFSDEEGWVWVGVHFGSRGFGHKTATGFMNLAAGRPWDAKLPPEGMDAQPTLLSVRSDLGQAYIEAMRLAGDYAGAGRDWVVNRVLSVLGTEATEEVHNHHNLAFRETHFGEQVWVVRKGCTPAFPGQRGFVGGSMGDISVILAGVDSDDSREGLFNTVHGAGRVMSRTQAAGKVRRRKVWRCAHRDCDRVFAPAGGSAKRPPKRAACPDHPNAGVRTGVVHEVRRPGLVDWEAARAALRARGIELRGGAADEAPQVYKRLADVLAAHAGTIRVEHRLEPMGVVMAGADVFDPFKD